MLRLQHVRPEDMPEVVRIAAELYASDQAQIEETKQRQGLIEAAGELNVPPEYLERAAASFHAERVAAIRLQRWRRTGFLAALALAVGLWGGWRLANPPPPSPVVYDFSGAPAQQWVLDRNPETDATLAFTREAGRRVAVIRVGHFGPRARDGTYYASLNSSDVPPTLSGYRTVSFQVRGSGLHEIRLYLEAGATERWRSPLLAVGANWQRHPLHLEQFDHQTRRSPDGEWQRQTYRPPGHIERLSFKVGTFVNDIGAHGQVMLDDVRFE